MADTTVTVRQDGTGDYTTISSAEAASNVSSGYYKIVIDDSNSYFETVNLTPTTGTPTSSNYVWLTVSEGNRHSGVSATSGHARLYSGNSTTTLTMGSYGRVEYLEIRTGFSGTTVHVSPNSLISRCIIRGANTTNPSNRGLRLGYGYPVYIDNCLVFANEKGVDAQSQAGNFYIDYCTIVDNTYNQPTSQTNIYFNFALYNSFTSNLYNTAMGLGGSADIILNNAGFSTNLLTHNGSHNAWDTNTSYFYSSTGSYTSSQDISAGGVTTTTTTANAMIVTSLTSGSEDYTPVPATGAGSNLLLTNGTNRQGSEPDPRQDFSTDIRGAARPTSAGKIDIGAFQITTAAGFKYWDGAAWADSTAVQYWNGSAWTDVTGIQYWNGSAWTDPS